MKSIKIKLFFSQSWSWLVNYLLPISSFSLRKHQKKSLFQKQKQKNCFFSSIFFFFFKPHGETFSSWLISSSISDSFYFYFFYFFYFYFFIFLFSKWWKQISLRKNHEDFRNEFCNSDLLFLFFFSIILLFFFLIFSSSKLTFSSCCIILNRIMRSNLDV